MGYVTSGIRSGAGRAGSAHEAAQSAVANLSAAIIDGGAFGEVNGATGLAGGLGMAREAFSRTSVDVADRHADLDGRARNVADAGDALVPETTRLAQRPAGSIAAAMQGE
jgi:hypothetical protein